MQNGVKWESNIAHPPPKKLQKNQARLNMAGKGIIVVLKGKGVVAISICYIVTNLACFGLNGLSRENSNPIESTPIV